MEGMMSISTILDIQTIAVDTVGSFGFGIVVGEFLYRCVLLLDEKKYLYSRYKDKLPRLIKAVFSNEHNQYLSFPIALLISLAFLYKSSMDTQTIILKVSSIILVWCVLRWLDVFDNPVDDIDVINNSNAALGPGLAYNYWNSLLKILLDKIEDKTREYENRMNERFNGNVVQAKSHPRLLILLPNDCDFNQTETALSAEGVYTHDPDLCDMLGTLQCDHKVEFEVEASQRRDPIKMNMHHIIDDMSGEKIYIMFDFPQLLKGAMGPKRDCDRMSRKQNLKSFQSTLENLLSHEPYRRHANSIRFIRYDKTAGNPLSRIIWREILTDRNREAQANLWSSSSGSEEE